MSALVTQSVTPLENVTGLGECLVEKLKAAGVNTVESLADMTPEQLEAIEGIGPKTVEKISIAVNNYFASLDGGEAVAAEGESPEEVATEPASAEEAPAASASEVETPAAEVESDATATDGDQPSKQEAPEDQAPEDKES